MWLLVQQWRKKRALHQHYQTEDSQTKIYLARARGSSKIGMIGNCISQFINYPINSDRS